MIIVAAEQEVGTKIEVLYPATACDVRRERARARPSGRRVQRTLVREHRCAIHRSRRAVRWVGGHPAGEFRAGLCKLCRCPVCQAAVRSICVVFQTPGFDLSPGVRQIQKRKRFGPATSTTPYLMVRIAEPTRSCCRRHGR